MPVPTVHNPSPEIIFQKLNTFKHFDALSKTKTNKIISKKFGN